MLDDLGLLTYDLVKYCVADNASNMVKGLNLSVADLYTCCIHTLQLAIGSFFFNISQLISICHLR